MEGTNNQGKGRIEQLKAILSLEGIDGYIIPSWDEYMSEYAPAHAKRLEYISGFTGSRGIALILLHSKSLFFTDGRYLEQAARELDSEVFIVIDLKDLPTLNWSKYLNDNMVIGYDPNIFTKNDLKSFAKLKLKGVVGNLVDRIWTNQPSRPSGKVYAYDETYAGKSHVDKILECRGFLKQHAAGCLIIAGPDSVCWLLNLRSSDVEFTPILLASAIVTGEEVYLFADQDRVSSEALRPEVKVMAESEFAKVLLSIEDKILLDENITAVATLDLLKSKGYEHINDPCRLWKSLKNTAELKYAQEGHIKDAAALCEFLAYIASDDNLANKTEYDLGLILTELRAKQPGYVMDSFATICGFKENGAVIHYRATEGSAKKVEGNGLLLIDSGGQYLGATTDVTRTIAIGTPTPEQKRRYTQVLKGHIALADMTFPKGVTGGNLDALARRYLWQDGQDYAHGTGHGVGSFLSVHEGPQSISLKNNVLLAAGMIVSNEPGFYKTGEYGIRIENLICVEEAETTGFLRFAPLTLVPYAKELIDMEMLERSERTYLNNYYRIIKEKVSPLLSEKAKVWVEEHINL